MENKKAVKALAALAQQSRLAIFRLLVRRGPAGLPVGRIGERLRIAPATLSFHLKELTRAELLTATQAGRSIIYSANFNTVNGVIAFLTKNCCNNRPERCIIPPPSRKPKSRRETRKL